MASTSEWLTSSDVARHFRISRNRLPEYIRDGLLLPGKHFVVFGRQRRYDLDAVEEALRCEALRLSEASEGEVYEKTT